MCVVVEKYGEDVPPALLVHAGREPLKFTNIFPFWQTDTSDVSVNFSLVSVIQGAGDRCSGLSVAIGF